MPLIVENPPPRMSDADEAAFEAARLSQSEPPLGPESRPRPNRIAGTLSSFVADKSRVYPEATRVCQIYAPSAYDGSQPANVIFFQDGQQYLSDSFNASVVIDNLIDGGSLPTTICVFIEPGNLIGIDGIAQGQRSVEYDSLNDTYSHLLLDEILPRVSERYRISDDPRNRAICGFSSGGIAAFTVAWHRPDAFGNVVSHCGSFTNLRGGGAYPHLVRTSPNRPIRIFLQSGASDMDRTVGNWAVANHDMAAALKLKGYDFRFEFGNGGHTLDHGAAIFPQTLRWIWRDAKPSPV